jgi:hypothetical protein
MSAFHINHARTDVRKSCCVAFVLMFVEDRYYTEVKDLVLWKTYSFQENASLCITRQ